MAKVINDMNIFKIGEVASIKKTVLKEDIIKMAEVSGDYNPIHIDETYAKNTIFGGCIAHGLFCLGMISNIVGMILPGQGSIFVNEHVNYKAPVYVSDEIEARVRINTIIKEKRLIDVSFECTNQDNIIVLDGDMLVKIL